MAREDVVVDQFVFDYYVNKCLDELKDNHWILTEEAIALFRALVIKAIQLDFPGNKLKAHLMIIVNSVIRLQNMGLENISDQLEDDSRTEILQQIDDLQQSVDYLHQSENASPNLKDISRQCLFQMFVWFVKVISFGLLENPKETDASQLLQTVLERMKSLINFQTRSEKVIFNQCERLLTHPGSPLDCPPLEELWSQLRMLVLEAALMLEAPSECSCQLKRKIHGEAGKERMCRLSDLMEIMRKTPEECQDEEQDNALREKCEQIKKNRQQLVRNSSQEQLNPSVKKQKKTYLASKSSTPRNTVPALDQDTSPESERESGIEKENTVQREYPALPSVKPRMSLLQFGNSRKPPSHTKVAGGKWLHTEEEDFIVKTLEIGEGKWAEIKAATGSLRSNVQLKDKWRLISLSQIHKVARNHGLVYRGNKKH